MKYKHMTLEELKNRFKNSTPDHWADIYKAAIKLINAINDPIVEEYEKLELIELRFLFDKILLTKSNFNNLEINEFKLLVVIRKRLQLLVDKLNKVVGTSPNETIKIIYQLLPALGLNRDLMMDLLPVVADILNYFLPFSEEDKKQIAKGANEL